MLVLLGVVIVFIFSVSFANVFFLNTIRKKYEMVYMCG